jgi:hypothetical protein
MTDFRQFKLTNGDEIICEIVQWPGDDEEDMIIRKAMQLKSYDDDGRGIRYYNFKPWITMQEDTDGFLSLNYAHILAEVIPSDKMLKHFFEAVENSSLSPEEIQNKIDSYFEKLKKMAGELDSDFSNVIEFNPDRNKLH